MHTLGLRRHAVSEASSPEALDSIATTADLVLVDLLAWPQVDVLTLRAQAPEARIVEITHAPLVGSLDAHDACTYEEILARPEVNELRFARLMPVPSVQPEVLGPAVPALVGTSLRALAASLSRYAASRLPVLILGESGTGKELVAETIHALSARASRTLVRVNCGALPEALVESELFGYEKGAFTGAHTRKKGRFELASGGTIFLDEIGELPLAAQVKLLRVLQSGTIDRIGGETPVPVDVRVVSATHRDLRVEVEAKRFREDLYYRLAVLPVSIPPLRERRGDIGELVEHFIRRATERRSITPAALHVLEQHTWPGNVRELENVIARVLALTTGPIDVSSLPSEIIGAQPFAAALLADTSLSYEEAVRTFERTLLRRTGLAAGSLSETARRLRLRPTELVTLLMRHELPIPR